MQIALRGTICYMHGAYFCANTLDLCHLNYFNNFVYTLIDHTFDHTVVDDYHMYSLHGQWDNDIVMGSTFKHSTLSMHIEKQDHHVP